MQLLDSSFIYMYGTPIINRSAILGWHKFLADRFRGLPLSDQQVLDVTGTGSCGIGSCQKCSVRRWITDFYARGSFAEISTPDHQVAGKDPIDLWTLLGIMAEKRSG